LKGERSLLKKLRKTSFTPTPVGIGVKEIFRCFLRKSSALPISTRAYIILTINKYISYKSVGKGLAPPEKYLKNKNTHTNLNERIKK